MKTIRIIISIAVLTLFFSSCQVPINYGTEPLSGYGDAEGWTFVSGTIDSDDGVIILGSVRNTRLYFTVSPLLVGEFKLKLNPYSLINTRTVTYYDGSTYNYISDGAYEITSITDTTVSGRMNIYDGYRTFDGTFELTRTN